MILFPGKTRAVRLVRADGSDRVVVTGIKIVAGTCD
jgi:hypothetical protein